MQRSTEVIALGRRLVQDLDSRDENALLQRWMAHYVAELIDAADQAPLDAKAARQAMACAAIIELWRHRAELPNGSRPFENLEAVLRTLERLNPEAETSWFMRGHDAAVHGVSEEQTEWLRIATRLDVNGRALIRYCLSAAAKDAPSMTEDYAGLIRDGLFEGADSEAKIVRIVLGQGEGDLPTGVELALSRTKSALERVSDLRGLADAIDATLQTKLMTLAAETSSSPSGEDDHDE